MNKMKFEVDKSIKTKIENLQCPIHHKSPKVNFTEKGFQVSCCCKEFEEEIISKSQKAIADALVEQIHKP